MSDPFVLETQSLVKEFKGFVAVDDVNLKVQRGHIHALIGPNGAGKTTVFNLLTKFLIPTRGKILFKGEDITNEIGGHCPQRGGPFLSDFCGFPPYDGAREHSRRSAEL